MDVLTILDGEQPVAAVLNFYDRDEVLPYYGGGTTAARAVAANDFMYWEVMRLAAAKGCRLFDFGRSKAGTGAFSFKKNWGFTPQPLYHRFRLKPGADVPDHNPLNPKYRLFIAAWKAASFTDCKHVGWAYEDRAWRGLGQRNGGAVDSSAAIRKSRRTRDGAERARPGRRHVGCRSGRADFAVPAGDPGGGRGLERLDGLQPLLPRPADGAVSAVGSPRRDRPECAAPRSRLGPAGAAHRRFVAGSRAAGHHGGAAADGDRRGGVAVPGRSRPPACSGSFPGH